MQLFHTENKDEKIYSFILLFPLLLVSCGEGNIDPSTSPSEEESYKLIVNCPGHEDESYENKSGDDLNPSHPSIKNYYFDGWYDQKVGGELVDFQIIKARLMVIGLAIKT